MPRLLIVDNHPIYRDALRQLLNGRSGLEVIGEAQDGKDALEQCRRLEPDVVLMDIRMPRMDGIEATRAIKQEFPGLIVLVLTALAEPNLLARALKAGASGYVLKDTSGQDLASTILSVLDGEYTLDQGLATQLLIRLLEHQEETKSSSLTPSPEKAAGGSSTPELLELLSPREVEVLKLVARGRTNQQIAGALFISQSTVKKHVRRIVAKLGVSDRVQAAVRAVEAGLLKEEETSS
jgi:DNA-binding NarL/FixJ family response regulator